MIPPFADVICDCRPLPGQTEEDIRDHVDGALGDDVDYELELLEPLEGGTESPIDTPLYRACEEYVASALPGRRAAAAHLDRASPTPTGCARLTAPSPTGSRRCSPPTRRLPAAASTAPTSASRSPIWSR